MVKVTNIISAPLNVCGRALCSCLRFSDWVQVRTCSQNNFRCWKEHRLNTKTKLDQLLQTRVSKTWKGYYCKTHCFTLWTEWNWPRLTTSLTRLSSIASRKMESAMQVCFLSCPFLNFLRVLSLTASRIEVTCRLLVHFINVSRAMSEFLDAATVEWVKSHRGSWILFKCAAQNEERKFMSQKLW